MRQLRRPRLLTFGLALLATIIAALLTVGTPLRTGGYLILFGVAVLVSARYGGFGVGLFAILLSGIVQLYFSYSSVSSQGGLNQDDLIRLGLFILTGIVIAWLTAERENTEETARSQALQHSIVAGLGRSALAGRDLPTLWGETTHRVAETLQVEYCQVLELLTDKNELLLRAGHGWKESLIDKSTVSAGIDSLEGLTLISREPVIVQDLRTDNRPSGLSLLLDHTITSGMSVVIPGNGRPFGVLSVFSTRPRRFTRHDVNFLQSISNVLAEAIGRKASEEQIRDQRELLSVTLSSIGDAVISADMRGDITFMNPVAESLTGWKMEEVAGKPLGQVFHVIHEETRKPVESPFARVMRDQAVVGLANHTMLVTRDGTSVPIDDSGAPIRDAHGKIIGVVLVFRDITKQRKTERDISRLAMIVESSEDAIISQRLDGIVLSWNPAAERLYGYSAEEVIGKPITLTYPPDRLDEYEDIMARLNRGETVENFDTVRLTKDGRHLDVSISVALLRDAKGQISGVSKIARDVTSRKRAEKVARFLAEASDVLASSLDYETMLVNVAQLAVPEVADWCAVNILDKDGTLKRVALAHVDSAKIKLADELLRRYPGDPNSNYGVYKVIRTGKPEIYPVIDNEMIARTARDVHHLELLMDLGMNSSMIVPLTARQRTIGAMTFVSSESRRHFDGTDLALAQDLARHAALAMDNARFYREAQELNEELEHRVVSRTIELQNINQKLQAEISERQRVNDQLRLLSGHLENAREEERIRIAREIHDEIGQLLTAIKMDLSMLGRELVEGKAGEDVPEEIGSMTRLLDDAIQTMHHIVRELRPEVLDHLDLRSALEWQVQEFQSRTKIESRFESELDELDLDPERSTALFRILQETLTNVARHAQANRIHAILKKADHQLVLQVQDDGKGIPNDRVTNLQTFGILGMRERARALGGDVDIESLPDHGTTVTVHIPV